MDRAARCMAAAPGHAGVDDEPIPDKKEIEARSGCKLPAQEPLPKKQIVGDDEVHENGQRQHAP
jgi:hypothetical protein